MTKYVPPQYRHHSYHCPFCGVFSVQYWYSTQFRYHAPTGVISEAVEVLDIDKLAATRCEHCNEVSIWRNKQMIFPDGGNAPLPCPEMPDEVKADFDEARGIVAKSPRGAAALLRLAIQRLMPHLGEKGEKLDADIAALVKKGLPLPIQQALDSVRVIGNESVHPGQIELNDTPEVAQKLFELVNFIVDKMIAEPKMVESIYGSLPKSKVEAIAKRDAK